MSNIDKSYNLINTIEKVLIQEIRSIVYDHKGPAYVKFVLLAVGIEFLGACVDESPFDKKNSEKRFNSALMKLFKNIYHKYAKKNSNVYFYEQFRCSFVHQFKPGPDIVITHREESKREGTTHLMNISNGQLVIVLEDFYDDFENACKKFIRYSNEGKITNKKPEMDFLSLTNVNKKK
ncbi:MAG: hypothetical protein IPI30_10790 [Saprospiraceae bacterium]|nr:hypothetical protein [Bacteroidota bacterium]MBK7302919.1 hypothetical protein [Candidatus Vicinibacter affinis]MBK7694780.1 hypothetical protein [Candidatus Vicinibacter affinis]